MSLFLKIVSGIYFVLIWLVAAVAILFPIEGVSPWHKLVVLVSVATLTLPVAALYAFGQVVGDVRKIRGHLAAMRRYYEPH